MDFGFQMPYLVIFFSMLTFLICVFVSKELLDF